MKVLELFGGIGACTAALKRLGIDFEVVDYVEIDKFAVKSYNAINNTNYEPQDVQTWDKDLEVDLVMHGSPCQDFSVAGLQKGGNEGSGTRSSLMYETLRIVEKLRPKYVIWENVKNVLSDKHRHNFDNYIQRLNELGYTSFYDVLNAKDFGIPQNRERVFVISIHGDYDFFLFPEPMELKLRLKDLLDDEVDDRFYLSDKAIQGFLKHNANHEAKGTGFKWKPTDVCGVAKCLRANGALAPTDNTVITQSCKTIRLGGLYDTDETKHQAGSIYDKNYLSPALSTAQGGNRQPLIIGGMQKHQSIKKDGICTALTASMGTGGGYVPMIVKEETQELAENLRIRRLTPKECFRLMGFTDEEFHKAESVNSNTQLYKQAGNSIVVNVLVEIFRGLLLS